MKKMTVVIIVIAALAIPSISVAQPPGGPRGGGRGGPGGGGSTNAVLSAIDADGNHEISAEEIKNAIAALKTLDKDKDGKLVRDEIHAEAAGRDRGGFGGGPGGRGGPRDAPDGRATDFAQRILQFDSNKDGKLTSEELPERMRSVLARYDADKNGSLNKAEIEKMAASRQDGGGQGGRGQGGPGGGPEGRGGGRGGAPSPDQLVTDAMEFDADKDGKLSRAELTKFAEEFSQRGPGGGGLRGGGFGGERRDRGGPGGGGAQRPARPE